VTRMNWTQEGREVGVTLDACHAVVVVGSDPTATAEVALGIARLQAQHRRVAVADMFGDAPPLQALITSDDPHGVVDSFQFGVSLNRIAHQVPDAGELFIMPSGTGPLDYAELFPSPRWRKLAAGFGEVGALLLIAAPADAAGIRALVESTDGAVLVGDTVPGDLPVAASLAWIRPRRSAPMSVAMSLPPAQSLPTGIEKIARRGQLRRLAGPAAGILVVLALAWMALWFARRPFADQSHARGPRADSMRQARAIPPESVLGLRAGSLRRDSVARDSVARETAARAYVVPADSFPTPPIADARDSATAAAWTVLLEETLTKSGAILNLEQKFKSVPAGTFGINPRTRFFPVFAGAFATHAAADSLLAALRSAKVLGPAAGGVVSAPFAYLVQSDVPAAAATARVAVMRASGHPVYALRQANGTMHLYFGAYTTPQQAALAVPELRKAKQTPTLVYRVGRVF
jgi:hypothetical protein